MKYRSHILLILGLCAGQAARADLTMRHTIEFKFGSFLPATAVEAMKTQLGNQMPKETVVQIKGRKVYTSMGWMVMIADLDKGVITLLDPKSQRFATSPMAAYGDKLAEVQKQKIPALPPQAQQMFENMKIDVKSDRTGKTATIQGLKTEENLLTISMEMPNPMGPGMQMRMEMHQWVVADDEVSGNPALKELKAYAALPKGGMEPMELMTKSLAGFPGLADKIKAPIDEIRKRSGDAILRMATSIYMPSMAQMMGGAADQPFTEYTMELTELSSAPVPDSRFEVPANYQSAAIEELIGAIFPSPKPAVPSAAPRAEALPPGVYRVGNGVTQPVIRSRVEPIYTEEARAARIKGTVLLSAVVSEDGTPQSIKVVRSLDPGLDRNAVEALGKWKFDPGMKDGKPVPVLAQIEMTFNLM